MMTTRKIGMVLGIAVLLVISYFIPTIVTVAEDNSLEKKTRTYQIENVTISQNENDFLDEIENFPDIMGQDKMYVKSGKNMTAEQVLEVEKAFVKLLMGDLYAMTFADSDQETMVYYDASAFLATSADYETVYYLWDCNFADAYGREYTLWIDDATGKVLGFFTPIPEGFLEKNGEVNQEICKNLMEYYGYQDWGLEWPEYGGEARLIFYNEEGKEILSLPIIFVGESMYVNMMDNSLSMESYVDTSAYDEDAKKRWD